MTDSALDGAWPWWAGGVVYQIYPRSFADGNGDGVGDLRGIVEHLDHVDRLGVDAIWLSPVYRSPMVDAGYDISDHCAIDPTFGTLADLDELVERAHSLGIRVLMDLVPNHTSDQHPWFAASRSSRSDPKRDWYIWRDQPNNWRRAIDGGSAWTWDEATEQYYLHFFLPQQPDLNWRNPAVEAAMHDVVRFWLDRGVDGFRIDVAHCIGKDPEFTDDPRCLAGQALADVNDQPFSHVALRRLRALVDSYPGERVLVGEVNLRDTASVATYYGTGDELHMAFNFPPLDAPWDPVMLRVCIEEVEKHLTPTKAWPTWVLSNHDNPRHRTRYDGSLRRARAAAVLLLTLQGTPFLFQGEELGLEDAVVPPDETVDPGGRDGARAPIPWTASAPHAWTGRRPWLPFPPDAESLAAEQHYDDPASTFHLYRRLIAARRGSAALRQGDWAALDAGPEVIAFYRRSDRDERITCVNFADRDTDIAVPGAWEVEVSSRTTAEGEPFTGRLAAEEGVLLRPAGTAGRSR